MNFESGAGWARDLPVIPVCHGDIRKDDLPYPLRIFQGINLDDAQACEALARRLAGKLKVEVAEGFDFNGMAKRLEMQPPAPASTIGIVLAHGQSEWDSPTNNSIFEFPGALPKDLSGKWSFSPLRYDEDLLSGDLRTLSGIILGNPWRRRMSPEVITDLHEWVMKGGRLLMLGFELGDRHHDGNLGELARRFGVYPAADIVGRQDFGPGKPYNDPVFFDVADADRHPLTAGLISIRLSNVQTMGVEPGGAEWLRVGRNVVYRPTRGSVVYRNGTLTQPGPQEYDRRQAGWMPVAVEAPAGLCGRGAVLAIGTWQLPAHPADADHPDNLLLLERLLDWLSGAPA